MHAFLLTTTQKHSRQKIAFHSWKLESRLLIFLPVDGQKAAFCFSVIIEINNYWSWMYLLQSFVKCCYKSYQNTKLHMKGGELPWVAEPLLKWGEQAHV